MATANDTMDTPQDLIAETEQLDTSDLEEVVGGNDPAPPPVTDSGSTSPDIGVDELGGGSGSD